MAGAFVAMKLRVENWRWADVPFYLRVGKRLPKRATEVAITFKRAPLQLFRMMGGEAPAPNLLVLRIQPDEGISLRFGAKVPGTRGDVRPMTVEPRAIESEFTRIWLETASGDRDRSSIRLRTLNFVGLGDDAAAQEKFGDAMQLLVERHPCRGILAITAPEFERLQASISARCLRAPGGSRDV